MNQLMIEEQVEQAATGTVGQPGEGLQHGMGGKGAVAQQVDRQPLVTSGQLGGRKLVGGRLVGVRLVGLQNRLIGRVARRGAALWRQVGLARDDRHRDPVAGQRPMAEGSGLSG